MTIKQMCTTCGHEQFYHEKAHGKCILKSMGGFDTVHTYTGTSTTTWAAEYTKFLTPKIRAPIFYAGLHGTPSSEDILYGAGTIAAGAAAYTEGRRGRYQEAFDFDGATGIQYGAKTMDFEVTQPFSVNYWFKLYPSMVLPHRLKLN